MDVDEVFSIEHVLRAAALLIAICQLADGHWNVEARQVLLRGDDLRRQLIGRQDVVEKRLRAKLHAARDKFSFGVRVQGGKEGVSPRLPDIRPVEAELRDQRNNQPGKCNGGDQGKLLTQTRACTPRVLSQAASTISSLRELVKLSTKWS